MCMITAIPAGVDLPWDGIENGAVVNNDGHGWAVASQYGIEVGKSMDFDVAMLGLAKAREEHGPGTLAMFHSRFATHGTVDEYNIHPFFVGEGDAVVAHNGILPATWHPTKKDHRSDTRILVDVTMPFFLNPKTGIPSRRRSRELGRLIGSGNKLTVLSSVDGVPRMRIVNAHLGEQAHGVWYSNTGYQPYKSYSYTGTWNAWTEEDEQFWREYKRDEARAKGTREPTYYESGKCEVCFSHDSIDLGTGICDYCEVCSSCFNDRPMCTCPWNREIGFDDEEWERANEEANKQANNLIREDELGGWIVG